MSDDLDDRAKAAARKKKGPGGEARAIQGYNDHTQQCSVDLTGLKEQRQRIIAALSLGPKTSYDLRRLGCYQCPTRVLELRRRGYDIRTELVTITDADGFQHPRVARYHLEGVPDGPGAE